MPCTLESDDVAYTYSVRTMTLLTLYSVRVSVARLRERVTVPVCESIVK